MPDLTRRALLAGLAGGALGLASPRPASAEEDDPMPDTLLTDRAGWRRVRYDGFTDGRLDARLWTAGSLPWGATTNPPEVQTYSAANVVEGRGKLDLVARRDAAGAWTSGIVHTKGKFSMLHGRVEIRARPAPGRGIWPAIWFLPEGWQRSSATPYAPFEVDLLENWGHLPDNPQFTYHWGDGSAAGHKQIWHRPFMGQGWGGRWHTFAFEWTATDMRWFVDDWLVYYVANYHAPIPNVPMYLVMNVACRTWEGTLPDATTPSPTAMRIEGVAWYQRG